MELKLYKSTGDARSIKNYTISTTKDPYTIYLGKSLEKWDKPVMTNCSNWEVNLLNCSILHLEIAWNVFSKINSLKAAISIKVLVKLFQNLYQEVFLDRSTQQI